MIDSRSPLWLDAVRRTLRADRFLHVFGAAVLLLLVPFAVPIWSAERLFTYSDRYLDFFVVPLVLAAVRHRFGEIRRLPERQFWNSLTAALLCWFAVRVLYVLVPPPMMSTGAHLAIDGLYLLFYLWLLMAVQTKPHLDAPEGAVRRLQSAGILGLGFALLVYFVLIPSNYDPREYDTWLSSFGLYIALDLVLLARFLQLARSCREIRWRTIYGFLAATAALWAGLDLLESFIYGERLPWPDQQAGWDLLWMTPFLTLVLAVRLRHRRFEDRVRPAVEDPWLARGALFSTSSPLILATLALPLLHLGLYGLGELAEGLRPVREVVVFWTLVALGALVLAENRMLRREGLHRSTLLKSLIESSPLAVLLLDPAGRVVTCNPAFESLFQRSRAEVLGHDVDDLIAGDETSTEARGASRRALAGETTYMVSRRRRSDGSEVDVRILGIPLRVDGRLAGIFAIYQDITERLRAERTLRESEERFRRLAAASFEGIVISLDGVIVDANEQFARIMGYPVEQMIGQKLGRRVVPEHKERVRQGVASGDETPYQVDCYRADRARITLEVQGKSIPYKGRAARVTAVRDVTERKRLEEQLVQSQKMEAVGRLAAGVAHDFNNLLTVILAHGSLLAERVAGDDLAQHHASSVVDAAQQASDLTRQLLSFSRKQPLEPRLLLLDDVVRGVEKMLARVLEAAIELRVAPDAGESRVLVDPGQLEQVLLNLAINARDAMPDGGRLEVATAEVALEASNELNVLAVPPGDYVELRVADTGTGIAPETLLRVFEPFFTTKEEGQGTGLGLATVYGIVQQNGGGIAVETAPGEGTTFRIYLPLAEAERPAAALG